MKPFTRTAALLLACLVLAGCMPRPTQPQPESSSSAQPAAPLPPPPVLLLSEEPALTLQAYAHRLTLPDGAPFAPPADEQQVIVTLDAPTTPAVTASAAVAQSVATVTRDGKEVFSGSLTELADFAPQTGGDYHLDIHVEWDDDAFRGSSDYRLTLRYQLPVAFELGSGSVPMGDPLVLRVRYAAPGEAVAASTNLNFTPQFFDYGDDKVALLPIHPGTKPGEYWVELKCGGSSARLSVKVSETHFEVQHIKVEESVVSSTINSSKANSEYAELIGPVRSIADPVKHWSGVFVPPIPDYERISSEYELTRYYNDNPNPDRHNGIDFPCPTGTPVHAPGAGRVVFAKYLQLTGNTVVIEHGLGLKSWYYHMDKLLTEEGRMVETGDIIGEVGSTGFSTGPHLHFGMSVNNVFINPWTMFENELL